MTTNVFFNHAVKTEQNLYEDLVVESLRMFGHDVYYLPRTIVEQDTILNEDIQSKYDDALMVEMYLENTDGISGDGDLMSKFGVYVQEEATFIMTVRSWDRMLTSSSHEFTIKNRPSEGDLIYLPLSGSLFEIRYVQDDNPFYQLGKLYVFRMQCTLFEYSGEDFDTQTNADLVELDQGYTVAYTLTAGTTGTFEAGENVTISGEVVGEVVAWSAVDASQPPKILTLRNVVGTISENDTIVGEDSGASGTIDTLPNPLDIEDGISQNQDFETSGSTYLDFSETNPFGEVN